MSIMMQSLLREFIATMDDWQGLHSFAESVRTKELGKFAMLMEIISLLCVPIGIIVSVVCSGRVHTRNCDCRHGER